MRHVLCVGECLLELTHKDANTLRLDFAGDTYNTAVYLRRVSTELTLQVGVGYLTGLGADDYSQAMRAAWRTESIVDHSLTVPERIPGIYTVRTSPAGERNFSYWRDQSAARHLFAGTEWCEHVQGDVVHLSGITLQLMSAQARKALIARLRDLRTDGTRVSLDTNYRAAGWRSHRDAAKAITELCSVADVVFTSREDEQLLAGAQTPQDTLGRLAEIGVQEAIVRDGAAGAYLDRADGVLHLPAHHVERVLDTTAAGDSFTGAYLAARLARQAPEEAATLATTVAATVIQYPGAITPSGVRLT